MRNTWFCSVSRFHLWFTAFVVAFLLCSRGKAQSADRAFFMLLADPQMGMFEKDTGWLQETANLNLAIDTANRLRPVFLVICGDLVNKRGDDPEIGAFLTATQRLDKGIPLHLVAGNHDLGNTPTSESLAEYRARFGPDFYSFQNQGLFAIVLDSSLMGTKGNETEDERQLVWLEQELKRAQQSGFGPHSIAVFQHIPFFLTSADEADQYFNVPAPSRRRYLALLHHYGVEHVFAGHYHRNAQAADGPLQMITTGAVGKPLGPDDSGLRLVHYGANWLAPYFALGRLPDSTVVKAWVDNW